MAIPETLQNSITRKIEETPSEETSLANQQKNVLGYAYEMKTPDNQTYYVLPFFGDIQEIDQTIEGCVFLLPTTQENRYKLYVDQTETTDEWPKELTITVTPDVYHHKSATFTQDGDKLANTMALGEITDDTFHFSPKIPVGLRLEYKYPFADQTTDMTKDLHSLRRAQEKRKPQHTKRPEVLHTSWYQFAQHVQTIYDTYIHPHLEDESPQQQCIQTSLQQIRPENLQAITFQKDSDGNTSGATSEYYYIFQDKDPNSSPTVISYSEDKLNPQGFGFIGIYRPSITQQGEMIINRNSLILSILPNRDTWPLNSVQISFNKFALDPVYVQQKDIPLYVTLADMLQKYKSHAKEMHKNYNARRVY